MRSLVIGATGLVGSHVLAAARALGEASGTSHSQQLSGLAPLDIRDGAAVKAYIARVRPDLVVLAAAEPWVDLCEREPARTRLVNVDGTRNVAEAAADVGADLVFFSSDYVFDGERGRYREDDPISPLNEYGRQKVEAESIVLGVPRSLVCRTSGVFGVESRRKNFVYQVVDRLRNGEVVRAAIDQILCPTAADELASSVTNLVARHVRGVVHVVGPEALPRVDFARRIAQSSGLPSSSIEAVPTSALGSVARRPRDSSLRCDRLVAATGQGLGPLDMALSRVRDAMQPPL